MLALDTQTLQRAIDPTILAQRSAVEMRLEQVPNLVLEPQCAISDMPPPATVNTRSDSARLANLDQLADTTIIDLERYSHFPRGWDGYDGEEFNQELVDLVKDVSRVATEFFRSLGLAPDEITPGPASDGSIDLELVVQGRRLILTFYPGMKTVGVYREQGTNAQEARKNLDGQGLVEWLRWLVG